MITNTDGKAGEACQYMRVICASRDCTKDAIHPLNRSRCHHTQHSATCYHNFCRATKPLGLLERLALQNQTKPKAGDPGNPLTRTNMTVFCAEHSSSHPLLPGRRMWRDMASFQDFWHDFGRETMQEDIQDSAMANVVDFNSLTPGVVETDTAVAAEETKWSSGFISRLSISSLSRSKDGKKDTDEVDKSKQASSLDSVKQTMRQAMQKGKAPGKLSVQQFKDMFKEYSDLLARHEIVYEDLRVAKRKINL